MQNKVIDLKIPTSWNQCTAAQIRFLCRLIAAGLNPWYMRQKVFMQFGCLKAINHRYLDDNGTPYYLFKHLPTKQFCYISLPDYSFYLRQIDWTQRESELSEQLFPSIKVLGMIKLYGPSKKIFNLTYGEFVHAESCFNRYVHTKKAEALIDLCALLYRPGSGISPLSDEYKGDRRKDFNEYTYTRHRWMIKLLPAWFVVYAFLYYTGSREAMYAAHQHLKESVSIGEDRSSDLDKHRRLVNSLNQGDITKNQLIWQTPVWDAFAMIDRMIEQHKQITRK